MFQNFEALVALYEQGTMVRAAARLGVSQPTITKRLQQLEAELGRELTEKVGRKLQLTPYALGIISRATPHYREFKEALQEEALEGGGELLIAVSGALLLSWNARILKQLRKENTNTRLRFSVHRSPIAIAKVRSGDCMLAIVHGTSELTPDLVARELCDEEFVIVPSELEPFQLPRRGKELSLLTVEAHSETWSALERRLRRWSSASGVGLQVENSLQNFLAVTQLAQAGFGNGLVPIGVPRALGIPDAKLVRFPKPGIQVPVSLVGRRTTLERAAARQFFDILKRQLDKREAKR